MPSDQDNKSNNIDDTANQPLTAWERWQLPNMDADRPAKANAYNIPAHRPANNTTAVTPEEEELKPLTAEDLEAIRQAAYLEGLEQGREAGKEEGYQQGITNAEADVKAMVTKLSQICRVLLEPIPAQDTALEQALLQMVEQICRRIVHRELILDSKAISIIVREAIDCLNPGSQRLRIHLNAEDTEFVLAQLKQVGEWDDSWRISAHPSITPGGCIIETDASLIDARAERRLAAVIQQVYEQQQKAIDERSAHNGNVDQLMEELAPFDHDSFSEEHNPEDEALSIDSSEADLVDIEHENQINEPKPAS